MDQIVRNNDVREAIKDLAGRIRDGADTRMVMSAVHPLWSLVCGAEYGGSVASLMELAASFEAEATGLVSEVPLAAGVGELGRGCALLRAGKFREAEEGRVGDLAELRADRGVDLGDGVPVDVRPKGGDGVEVIAVFRRRHLHGRNGMCLP